MVLEENLGCLICHAKSSRQDHDNRILRTHVENVIDIKPQNRDKEDPLTYEDDVEQVVIKCAGQVFKLNQTHHIRFVLSTK